MSSIATPKVCVEETNNHAFLRKFTTSRVDRVKRNTQAGCRVCGLVYRAIEILYADQFRENEDTLEFRHFGRILSTFSLATMSVNHDSMIFNEIVYEVPQLNLDSWKKPLHNQRLEGIYSPLEILPGRKIPALPEESVDLMRHWIQQCIISHQRCWTESYPQLPKRVLDVGTSREDSIRLHESNGQRAHYTALSHRWGKSQLLTTKADTLDARKKSISWSSLSQTFQDSVTLTRLLGVQYLWIDSLCIIQDDAIDWEIESAKMAEVYENSYVTISANTSTGPLLGHAAIRTGRSQQLEVADNGGMTSSVVIRPFIDHSAFSVRSLEGVIGPDTDMDSGYLLFKRAWCFQERLLATRILHFTDEEVVFECKTQCDCECGSSLHEGDTSLKSHFGKIIGNIPEISSHGTGNSPWDGWTQTVNQYVRKDITYPSDTLPALAGIASRIKCEELGRYIAGLWENQLPCGLFWFVDLYSCSENIITTAPSFSWASLAGNSIVNAVTWTMALENEVAEQLFQVIAVQCDVGNHNPFGLVTKASIQLNGYLLPVVLKGAKRPGYNSIIRTCGFEKRAQVFMDRAVIADMAVEMEATCFFGFRRKKSSYNPLLTGSEKDEAIFCLLLLKRVGIDVYQRVGCVPKIDDDTLWLKSAGRKEFTLV